MRGQVGTRIVSILFFALSSFLIVPNIPEFKVQAQCNPVSGASGPDAVAAFLANPTIHMFGCIDGTQVYSSEGGICNVGTAALPGDITTNHHGRLTSNLYRLDTSLSRFEQIGMSWIKHDDWTFTTSSSATCGSASCTPVTGYLGVGCRDVYEGCTNGNPNWLGPRAEINPWTGAWPVGVGSATFCNDVNPSSVKACRLQVAKADLETSSAQYFVETQVITPDEGTPEKAKTLYQNL